MLSGGGSFLGIGIAVGVLLSGALAFFFARRRTPFPAGKKQNVMRRGSASRLPVTSNPLLVKKLGKRGGGVQAPRPPPENPPHHAKTPFALFWAPQNM
jgi:hypothetical protein